MINTLSGKELAVAIACALALGVFSEAARAQAQGEHALGEERYAAQIKE